MNIVNDFQCEGGGQLIQHQRTLFQLIMTPRLTIHFNADQSQIFAIKTQWRIGLGQAFDAADSGDTRGGSVQFKGQVDIGDGVIRSTVIMAIFYLWLLRHKSFSSQ